MREEKTHHFCSNTRDNIIVSCKWHSVSLNDFPKIKIGLGTFTQRMKNTRTHTHAHPPQIGDGKMKQMHGMETMTYNCKCSLK